MEPVYHLITRLPPDGCARRLRIPPGLLPAFPTFTVGKGSSLKSAVTVEGRGCLDTPVATYRPASCSQIGGVGYQLDRVPTGCG